jgi:hypothetical protein
MKARAATLLMLAALLAATPVPTAALCASGYANPMLSDDRDQVVFVGTAVELAGIHNALFQVEEVWRGGPVPEWQVVRGTESANRIVEDLPVWEVGGRYLVEAHRRGAELWTLVCGSQGSQAYGAEAMSYRPPDVEAPTSAIRPLLWQFPVPFLILGGLGIIVVGSFYVVSRRRRPA